VLLMWSVAFYITENFVHELKEMDFVSKLFQVVCHVMCHLILPLIYIQLVRSFFIVSLKL